MIFVRTRDSVRARLHEFCFVLWYRLSMQAVIARYVPQRVTRNVEDGWILSRAHTGGGEMLTVMSEHLACTAAARDSYPHACSPHAAGQWPACTASRCDSFVTPHIFNVTNIADTFECQM